MTTLMHLLEGMAAQAEVPALIHALGWTLLHFCWQGAAIATLLWCVLALTPVRMPRARYAAASLTMALMVALPMATFVRLAGAEIRASRELRALPIVMEAAIVVDAGAGDAPEPLRDRVERALDDSAPWVPAVWLAGVVVFLVRLNLGLAIARRMRSAVTEPAQGGLCAMLATLSARLGVRRAVRLAQSAMVEVPTVIGWLRPVVLIPVGCLAGLSVAQVEAILAHELAHIRRHDYLVSVMQSVVEALLFYHPAVWWVSRQMRRERESCCDDVAVKLSGDRIAYARALSWLEEHRATTPDLVLGANGGVLKMRIRRLLGLNENAAASRGVAITLLSVVAAVTIWYAGTIAYAQSGQSQPSAVMSNAVQTPVSPAAAPIPSEIEVDQSCRIVTMDLGDPAHPRPQYRTDHIICHTESAKDTLRREETIANGVKTKRRVDIREHEFLLQNPYPQPITFVVHQALPTGYHIDSDPQPNDVTNSIATFRVFANPGQTVRLHIGWSDEVLRENSDLLPVKQIGNGVSEPVLTHSVPPEYTPEAKKAKTEGTVLVNLIVNEKGRPENVHARLQTAAPATDAAATLAQERGAIEGTIVDSTGALVPRAQVTAVNTNSGWRMVKQTDNTGKYSLSPLPAGPYNVEVFAKGFQRLLQENVRVGVNRQVELDLKLTVGAENTTVSVTGAPVAPPPPPAQAIEVAVSKPSGPQRVSTGALAGNLISKVDPVYPDEASAARVQGVVVLRAVIAKDGAIKKLTYISGPPPLVVSAIEAVQQWKYKPYLLNGEPTEVETTITVNYSFEGEAGMAVQAPTVDSAGQTVRRIGGGVSAPTLTYQVPPEYTPEAKQAKTEGTVLVDLIVDDKGRPEKVHVLRGLGNGLDEKAVESVRGYKFLPALEAGQPVPVELNVEVNFKIF